MTRYTDSEGAVWEDVEASMVRCVFDPEEPGTGWTPGKAFARTFVEESYGPLTEVRDQPARTTAPFAFSSRACLRLACPIS